MSTRFNKPAAVGGALTRTILVKCQTGGEREEIIAGYNTFEEIFANILKEEKKKEERKKEKKKILVL